MNAIPTPKRSTVHKTTSTKKKSAPTKPIAFVAMSFKLELEPVYLKIIHPVLEKYGYECIRGDEITTTGIIIDQIRDCIIKAKVIVCDLTYSNPNVYYELGMAHAYGKRTILISQDPQDCKFDVKHQRIIEYKDEKYSLLDLRDALSLSLTEISKKKAKEDNYAFAEIPVTSSELEAARAALYHQTVEAQRYAVHFLGDYQDKAAYERILSLTYPSNNPDLIRDALTALYKIDPEKAWHVLSGYQGIECYEHCLVRERAILLLGNYPPTEDVINKLFVCLRDDWSWGVRVAACQVLGRWQVKSALDVLKDRRVDQSHPVRAAAEAAIEEIVNTKTSRIGDS
ncbi:MAG: HEAT repeat domain-containing protein [Anaerolineae bacterium]|nr:HEAT repeat domain-containing protein [Anaerolineae bacterium]